MVSKKQETIGDLQKQEAYDDWLINIWTAFVHGQVCLRERLTYLQYVVNFMPLFYYLSL